MNAARVLPMANGTALHDSERAQKNLPGGGYSHHSDGGHSRGHDNGYSNDGYHNGGGLLSIRIGGGRGRDY